jgi:hypothetical protein
LLEKPDKRKGFLVHKGPKTKKTKKPHGLGCPFWPSELCTPHHSLTVLAFVEDILKLLTLQGIKSGFDQEEEEEEPKKKNKSKQARLIESMAKIDKLNYLCAKFA